MATDRFSKRIRPKLLRNVHYLEILNLNLQWKLGYQKGHFLSYLEEKKIGDDLPLTRSPVCQSMEYCPSTVPIVLQVVFFSK